MHLLVLFNSSTHNFHKIWKSFLQTELQSLRLSELVLELQLADSGLLDGQLITQTESGATGRFVGYGGSALQGPMLSSTLGVGYTPTSGPFTFTNVAMTAVTGHGVNAYG